MAVATVKTVFDGEIYEIGDNIPDMGSLHCVSVEGQNRRNYEGLSADVAKLPHYDSLETGSSAFFYDTSAVMMYEKTTDTWIEL